MAEPADPGGIDPGREALLGMLARHRVGFVLIGGAAIQSHGRRYDTQDIDLTPDAEPGNLARLADALGVGEERTLVDAVLGNCAQQASKLAVVDRQVTHSTTTMLRRVGWDGGVTP